MAEGPPTLYALIGFLACVYSLMFGKCRAVSEAFSAFMTFIRSLSCVHLLVFDECGAVTNGLPAILTSVWFLFYIGFLMHI